MNEAPPAKPGLGCSGFIALVLLSYSWVLIWSGTRAIRQQYYASHWAGATGFHVGPFGTADVIDGLAVRDGIHAVRWGVGYLGLATVIGLWGIATLASLFTLDKKAQRSSPAGRILAGVSLVGLLTAIYCLFPPSHLENVLFYLANATIAGSFAYALFRPGTGAHKPVLVGVVILVMITLFNGWIDAAVGFGIALLVSFVLAVHLIILIPSLQTRMDADTKP